MPSRAEPVYVIRRVDQLKALKSQTGLRVLMGLEEAGPCSVGELAAHLGLKAESLYYHVRRLERTGLVRETERRQVGRREEAVYDVVSRRMLMDPEARSPGFLDALGKIYAATLRRIGRQLEDALAGERSRKGPCRNAQVRTYLIRLRPSAQRELQRRLEEFETFLYENNDPRAGDTFSLTSIITRQRD